MLDLQVLGDLVADARLAPSVHNIQPTRWGLGAPGTIHLYEDPDRKIPVADPNGRDVAISHGAAIEGMLAALAARGLAGTVRIEGGAMKGRLPLRAVLDVAAGPRDGDPLDLLQRRATWRGEFETATAKERADAAALGGEDVIAVSDAAEVARIAARGDQASMFFLRDPDHRRELRHWMRLSTRHPDWSRDGLSADAMQLGRVEAVAAGAVLGQLFRPLDRIGLAAPLLAEKAKTAGAAAILLFHRPTDEDQVTTGRAYYRCWAAAERAGLAGCPMSVLADWPDSNRWLAERYGVPDGRTLIAVFRVGRLPASASHRRVRLPVEELLIT